MKSSWALADRAFWERRVSESLTRTRNFGFLLAPAGRGAARLLMERVTAAPRQVYVGAALTALLAGIGGGVICGRSGGMRRRLSSRRLAILPRRLSRPLRIRPRRRSPRLRPRRRTSRSRPRPQLLQQRPELARPKPRLLTRRPLSGRRRERTMPPRMRPTRSALSCAASRSMTDRVWCAPPRSRS